MVALQKEHNFGCKNLIDVCDGCRDEARSYQLCGLNFPLEYNNKKVCLRWGGVGLDLCRCGIPESAQYDEFVDTQAKRHDDFTRYIGKRNINFC